MSLGRRRSKQESLFVHASELPQSPEHPFYRRLEELLREADFDRFAEAQCAPFYADGAGRRSIPPGVYFRMLFIGYFEKIASQRGIAWRCSDSLSIGEFLGLSLDQRVPDHSSMTVIRKRLPLEVFEQIFAFVLQLMIERGVVKGRMVAGDSTMLEANAAMKSIIRRDTRASWKKYVRRLIREDGDDDEPTEDEIRRFDRKRKKTTSNKDWKSETDPDAKIARMKDGRTKLAYKAEHTVDLETGAIVDLAVYDATDSDAATLLRSVARSQANLLHADSGVAIRDVVADKGYHKAETLAACEALGLKTYVPERKSRHRRRWTNKPEGFERAVRLNRRRTQGSRGARLSRRRSEYVERSFAHLYGPGGLRRTWIRGLAEARKRHMMQGVAANLGLIMRAIVGAGTPKEWAESLHASLTRLIDTATAVLASVKIACIIAVSPCTHRSEYATAV